MATYNVNDKLPPQGTTELASLVGKGQEDLLVFGFEEVGELTLPSEVSSDRSSLAQICVVKQCCYRKVQVGLKSGKKRYYVVWEGRRKRTKRWISCAALLSRTE